MSIHRKKKDPSLPRGITRRASPTGETYFRVRVSYEMRQYELGPYMSLGDAKAALEIARGQIVRGTFIPPRERRARLKARLAADTTQGVTLRTWTDTWLQRLADEKRSPGTVASYRSVMRVHVLDRLGDKRLIDITQDDITELVDHVRSSGGPWRNVVRTLRACFHTAVFQGAGGLTVSPVRVSIPKGKDETAPIDSAEVASPQEVKAMAAAMPAEYRIGVLLAAWCALRLGELLGLQRRDFENLDDPEAAVLHVRRQWLTKANPPTYTDPKRGSARTVAIPASLLPELRDHLNKYVGADPEAALLRSPRDPRRPVSQTALDRYWRAARANVRPGFRFHALRHSGLTYYARQGATLSELQYRGGHRDVEAAMKYQHAAAERDRELTRKLDTGLEG